MTNQGSFTRSLFGLISRAAFIDVDGQEVEQIDQMPAGALRMVTDTEQILEFDPFQLVTIDANGSGQAITIDGTVMELAFMVLRPMTAEDCEEGVGGSQ